MVAGEGLRVTPAITIPEAELQWRFSRSSGPGGQGVNTADSRVELSWDLGATAVLTPAQRERVRGRLGRRTDSGGVITVAASEHRGQLRNRQAAAQRLATLIAGALAPPPRKRRATKPTRGSVQRRLQGKKQRGSVKQNRRRPGIDS